MKSAILFSLFSWIATTAYGVSLYGHEQIKQNELFTIQIENKDSVDPNEIHAQVQSVSIRLSTYGLQSFCGSSVLTRL